MSARGAVGAFLERQSRTYERLLVRAFDDGIAHASAELGVAPRITTAVRERTVNRLVGFYHPSLLKFQKQIIALLAQGADDQQVSDWFARNSYRIQKTINGLIWSAGEAGYAAVVSASDLPIHWNLDGSVIKHCATCPVFAAGSPYRGFSELPAWPGDGTTECGGECYCYLTAGHATPDL